MSTITYRNELGQLRVWDLGDYVKVREKQHSGRAVHVSTDKIIGISAEFVTTRDNGLFGTTTERSLDGSRYLELDF